jgi:hypothetical protein
VAGVGNRAYSAAISATRVSRFIACYLSSGHIQVAIAYKNAGSLLSGVSCN